MTDPLTLRLSGEVLAYARGVSHELYGKDLSGFVLDTFPYVDDMFHGKGKRFQPIDLKFHDLEHTLRAASSMITVMRGINLNHSVKNMIPHGLFEVGVVAVLFHDSGYLRPWGKKEGSGAVYTSIHVERSCRIISDYFREIGVSHKDQCAASNMILCTGLNLDTGIIPFQSEQEKMAGFALGTGDLLGQMSDPEYIRKLPFLYDEFHEAHEFDPDDDITPSFVSAHHLIINTPKFHREYVLKILDTQLGGVSRYLHEPYSEGVNAYLVAIEGNVSQIERTLM
ncbi:MAG: hypothetical protein SGI98_02300 [Verrucomicrobiota bacterium]|nr:hypothetical protein [Verrucomicrobiota bacterium]